MVFILQKLDPNGKPTLSAHPGKSNQKVFHLYNELKVTLLYFSARFSPEDKYSRQRITIKKRFGLLMTQKAEPVY